MSLLRSTLVVLLFAVAAACAQESGEDVMSGGEDPELRREYAEAITFAIEESTDEDDLPLSGNGAVCFGEAWVEVIGVAALAEKVTPAEIRAEPDEDASDWGIEVSDDQGVEIFRQLIDCEPSVMSDFGALLAEEMGTGADGIDVDPDCLAEADPAGLEALMGGLIAADGDDATEEQAETAFEWINGCADLRAAMIEGLVADEGLDADDQACLEENIDEELVRNLFVTGMSGADMEDSPAARDLIEAIEPCATASRSGG